MIYSVVAPVLLTYLLYEIIVDQEKYEFSLRAIAIVFLILSVLSMLETFTSFNLWDKISGYEVSYIAANGYRYGLARARGAFETSINNGMFMVLGQGVLLYCITKYKKSLLFRVSYTATLIAAILIMSRATIIACAVLTLLWMFKSGMRKLPMRIIKIALILLVLYGLVRFLNITVIINFFEWLGNTLNALIDSRYVDYDANIGDSEQRLLLFGWIYEATSGHRLLGLGEYGVFSKTVNNVFTKTSIENYFLWIFFRLGWVGLITIIVLLVMFMIHIIKHDRLEIRDLNKNEDKLTFPGMMLCTTLVYVATNFACAGQNDTLFFCALVGIVLAYTKLRQQGVVA